MNTYTRKEAAAHAKVNGLRYRIKDDEVHFYGQMPNSNTTGWYLGGWFQPVY